MHIFLAIFGCFLNPPICDGALIGPRPSEAEAKATAEEVPSTVHSRHKLPLAENEEENGTIPHGNETTNVGEGKSADLTDLSASGKGDFFSKSSKCLLRFNLPQKA